ncbi:hypothetical protein [Bradyrhizobium cenepequi]|jgi:hypothetical protein
MSVNSHADDLSSAVHYALQTTHAIAICPFHLDVTIRVGDDAAESHAIVRARKLIKSDGTTWDGEVLRRELARQLSKAADRYCPHCVVPDVPRATCEDADVNPSLPSFGGDYREAVPWLQEEPQFACEACGDLVTLERAKLRGNIRSMYDACSRFFKRFKRRAKVALVS